MQLLTQCYDGIELQRIRSELESRKIAVHVSDEFTFAIPGMTGAEQPRGVWVSDEDLMPARRVVADLLGEHRIARPDAADDVSTVAPASTPWTSSLQTGQQAGAPAKAKASYWWWLAAAAAACIAVLLY